MFLGEKTPHLNKKIGEVDKGPQRQECHFRFQQDKMYCYISVIKSVTLHFNCPLLVCEQAVSNLFMAKRAQVGKCQVD
jgi:hypothetical protein